MLHHKRLGQHFEICRVGVKIRGSETTTHGGAKIKGAKIKGSQN